MGRAPRRHRRRGGGQGDQPGEAEQEAAREPGLRGGRAQAHAARQHRWPARPRAGKDGAVRGVCAAVPGRVRAAVAVEHCACNAAAPSRQHPASMQQQLCVPRMPRCVARPRCARQAGPVHTALRSRRALCLASARHRHHSTPHHVTPCRPPPPPPGHTHTHTHACAGRQPAVSGDGVLCWRGPGAVHPALPPGV
jgi:hypothetical protein